MAKPVVKEHRSDGVSTYSLRNALSHALVHGSLEYQQLPKGKKGSK